MEGSGIRNMTEKHADDLSRPGGERLSFPPGLHNAYLFSVFNACSFQIVLSSPMVLYAKTLGASATVLGIIAGMMPLLVIFQIPAASYIPRLGFKRFVYAGWGTRVMFIFAMALVPVTGIFLKGESRLALMLMLLFCFNLSRGISSCAWLPWITALVPSALRGKYLARDAAVQNLASFITFLIAAGCLAGSPRSWQFAVLFAFSAIMGAISLTFLKRIPDAEMSEEVRTSKSGVPWLEMIRFAPFQRLLRTLVGYSIAYGGITAFTVAFLKSEAGMSEGMILLVNSVAYLGGAEQPLVSGLAPGSPRKQAGPDILFCGLAGCPGRVGLPVGRGLPRQARVHPDPAVPDGPAGGLDPDGQYTARHGDHSRHGPQPLLRHLLDHWQRHPGPCPDRLGPAH